MQRGSASGRASCFPSHRGVGPPWSPVEPEFFFYQPNFTAFRPPISPQGIPAEWVIANLVLLVPLMLATPAPSWRARFGRLAIALAIALLLQVVDIIVTIKAFYAGTFGGQWSLWATRLYQFLDAFVQSFDTQLFPFTIWAGIHFRQLLGDRLSALSRSPSAPSPGHTRGRSGAGGTGSGERQG